MSTAAHPIDGVGEFANPNVVKVVLDAQGFALYFSRAPIPWWRDGFAAGSQALPEPAPLRHVGIYGYRAGFLRAFPRLAPAPIEARGAGAAARPVARPPHRGARDRRPRRARRRHAGRPGARARPLGIRLRVSKREGHACYPLRNEARRPAASCPARSALRFLTSEDIHETDPVGRARRRQRHAGHLHLPEIRHPADLHRRHAARRGQGRHAAGPRGQEGHGFGRAGQRRHHHRPGQGTHRAARLRQGLPVRRLSRAPSRRPTR